jgi:Fic family protein
MCYTEEIDLDIQEKLTLLTAKLELINTYRPLSTEQVDLLNKEKRIDHVWSSNAIEGSTLSRAETASILETGVTIHGKPIKEVLETIDLGKAYDFMEGLVSGNVKLTERLIKEINRIVRKADEYQIIDSEDPIGEYRPIRVYPYGVEGVEYTYPENIPTEMNELLRWNAAASKELHPVEYAALLHLKFVSIHPFANGNGRTGRLLMEFALTGKGYPITNIQPDRDARTEYIDALSTSQREKNGSRFVSYICDKVLDEMEFRIKTLQINEQINPSGKVDSL